MRILRYERACNSSEELAESLSDYVEVPLPVHSIAARVRPQPDGSAVKDIHPDVERLCRTTWDSFAGCPEL